MTIEVDKSFVKDVSKINDEKILLLIADLVEEIEHKNKISEFPNCKKLKGSQTAYRLKIKDYRVGFFFENNIIFLVRFLHRKEIYRYFP